MPKVARASVKVGRWEGSKADKAMDKRQGYKEGSAEDDAIDRRQQRRLNKQSKGKGKTCPTCGKPMGAD